MIGKVGFNQISFKAGRANILATADNHGNLNQLPLVLKTVEITQMKYFRKPINHLRKTFLQ